MKVLDKVVSVGGKIAGAVTLVSIYGSVAHAQADVGQIEGVPILDEGIRDIISTVVSVVLWGAGVIAFAYLIFGGITYITAGGDAEKAGKGRTAIVNAIIGIVIIAAALAIYNGVRSGLLGGGEGAIQ